jgi:hypothetical protein
VKIRRRRRERERERERERGAERFMHKLIILQTKSFVHRVHRKRA